MKIADVLREECVVVNAKFVKKAEVLREVARTAKKSAVLSNVSEQEILKGLEARESLGSTGVGKGIAIPHCRLESVSDFVVGLITVPSGVDFKALDKQKVNIIIFIIAPKADPNKHLRLLSTLSQMLLMPGVIEEILQQDTPEGVRESFLKHASSDIEADGEAGKSLLHVFVQDESMFKEILQVLAAVPSGSIAVLSAENTGAYLMKMPLFAEFWSDKPSKFSRIIIATVNRGLVNEAVRRIESITGDLKESVGVMVTVQDVSYAAGSLDT
ncbi:MAG TPA: PTS sugar transporter subunit IIA [Sedimentisphaerales bacterium]|nr:PTS sugar transporter subunit IIA [Sedimentisphaerales bacterium]